MRKLRALLTRRNALVLAAGIALWHFAAFSVLVFSPADNNTDNFTPDRIREVTYKEFAGELGLTAAPVPLTLDPYDSSGDTVTLGVMGDFVNQDQRYLALESRMRGHEDHVVLGYDKIQWATGPNPSIELTYGDEVTEVLLVGKGYDYWRFITFRGAKSYVFDPEVNDDGTFLYADVGSVIENAEAIKITFPDDPAWQKAMGRIG